MVRWGHWTGLHEKWLVIAPLKRWESTSTRQTIPVRRQVWTQRRVNSPQTDNTCPQIDTNEQKQTKCLFIQSSSEPNVEPKVFSCMLTQEGRHGPCAVCTQVRFNIRTFSFPQNVSDNIHKKNSTRNKISFMVLCLFIYILFLILRLWALLYYVSWVDASPSIGYLIYHCKRIWRWISEVLLWIFWCRCICRYKLI